MKRGFTLVELLVSITIIGILASIGLNTFTSAQIKSRDTKRKSALNQISRSLEMYFNDYKKYPDDDGNGNLDGYAWNGSFQDAKGTIYMIKLPIDPTLGYSYFYASLDSGKKFQLYARLENSQDPAIMNLIGPACGTKTCNYGISSTNITPEEGRL